MKIGIVSDSHGGTRYLDAMLKMPGAEEAECWLHAGDFTDDADYLERVSRKKVYKVAGNGDWPSSKVPNDILVELAGHRIFLTHGHIFGVRYTTGILVSHALDQGADIAVYGHTHVADLTTDLQGIMVLNPGSVARPRDHNNGSFILMELQPQEVPQVELYRMPDID